jgi:hypothetical protein
MAAEPEWLQTPEPEWLQTPARVLGLAPAPMDGGGPPLTLYTESLCTSFWGRESRGWPGRVAPIRTSGWWSSTTDVVHTVFLYVILGREPRAGLARTRRANPRQWLVEVHH